MGYRQVLRLLSQSLTHQSLVDANFKEATERIQELADWNALLRFQNGLLKDKCDNLCIAFSVLAATILQVPPDISVEKI